MPRKKLAIDLLRDADGEIEATHRAVKMHMDCTECEGRGGNSYYPEDPCWKCGFNYADSFGVEPIIDFLTERS